MGSLANFQGLFLNQQQSEDSKYIFEMMFIELVVILVLLYLISIFPIWVIILPASASIIFLIISAFYEMLWGIYYDSQTDDPPYDDSGDGDHGNTGM